VAAAAAAAAAVHAAGADASVHLSTVSMTDGRGRAVAALKHAELEVEPSAWSAQGSFTVGTPISPRGMPESRRYVAAAACLLMQVVSGGFVAVGNHTGRSCPPATYAQ
jgi:hypothetical protein